MSISETGFWNIDGASFDSEHYFDSRLAQGICAVLQYNNVNTAYDFGCGNGQYTQTMISCGIQTVGFDGNPVTSKFPNCEVLDLTTSFALEPVDLVLCLEVGEHVPEQFEDKLIMNIDRHVKSGGRVILSWAIPGQIGLGHVNCKTNEYIRDRFSKLGYVGNLRMEGYLREMSTLHWFKNTIMVFEKMQNMLHVERSGGIGNQLFQIVNVMARTNNYCICYLKQNVHSSDKYTDSIFKNISHKCSGQDSIFATQTTPTFGGETPLILNEHIYSSIKDVIPSLIAKLDFSSISTGEYQGANKAFLHIRGGDYIGHGTHWIDLADYYARAVAMFPVDTEFYVFTNDMAYAKQQTILSNLKYTFVEGLNEVESLVLMSRCSLGGVCANSTFSWWGAMLNPDRILTLPSRMTNDVHWEMSSNYAAPCFRVIEVRTPISCIHLPYRTDRYANITRMQEMYPFLDIHFVDAVQHADGKVGCTRSHKKIIQAAKDEKRPIVIVIEDDCEFLLPAAELKQRISDVLTYMLYHPNVEVVNGCGNLINFEVSTCESYMGMKFLKSSDVRTTHIMFYSAAAYDKILAFNEYNAIDEQLNGCNMVFTYPYLARQMPCYSDINKEYADYQNIEKSMEFIKRIVESR